MIDTKIKDIEVAMMDRSLKHTTVFGSEIERCIKSNDSLMSVYCIGFASYVSKAV